MLRLPLALVGGELSRARGWLTRQGLPEPIDEGVRHLLVKTLSDNGFETLLELEGVDTAVAIIEM
ncbi:MAG: hypothetical protein WBM90_08000 [Acidimicrobiia bacterium]